MYQATVAFKVVTANNAPVTYRQVIIRVIGRYEYGITDKNGFVAFPMPQTENGKVIIDGRTRYYGPLDTQEVIVTPWVTDRT